MNGKVKIYTKTGDKGKTGLYGGKRVFKDDCRVEVYGGIDELNCFLGLAISKLPKALREKGILVGIQEDLMIISSMLAGVKFSDKDFLSRRVDVLEKEIDKMEEELPVLRNFIVPGGSEVSALLQAARAICRRAEREIITVSKKEKIGKDVLVYINRLSDLLFVLARFMNKKDGVGDSVWLNKQNNF